MPRTLLLVVAAALVAVAVLFGGRLFRTSRPLPAPAGAGDTPLVRTDFSDAAAWARVRALIARPTADGFLAHVRIVEDRSLAGLAPAEAARRFSPSGAHALVILADARTMRDPEHSLLCVQPRTLETLRVIPSELWSIENNLSLANLDWQDFAEAAGKDGVLRGFKDEPRH